jgi:hypothetical protein
MVERKHFAPGQEPEVLTTISEQCSENKCWECPGIMHSDEYPDKIVLCVHECHKKRNQGTA